MSVDDKTFGRHTRSLRRARGWTQEKLAERSQLSADSIRRIERGVTSPSLTTIRKLCVGFGIEASTFFVAAELGERDERRELVDLVLGRPQHEVELSIHVLQALFEAFDAEGDG